MNVGQYEGLMSRLDQILDRMPKPATVVPVQIDTRTGPKSSPNPSQKVVVCSVLYALLNTLDSWIEGAAENHEALGHRGESRGEECWTQFHPADIRNMINDVAREFHVAEFPAPAIGKEDQIR